MQCSVLSVSQSNGNVLIGNQKLGSTQLFVSTDRGSSWSRLPTLLKERGKPVTVLVLSNKAPIAHAVAIDPDPTKDPLTGQSGLRLLVAGRRGLYQYQSTPESIVEGQWSVLNSGIERSEHFEDAVWMGHVAFDPRPGRHHVVYACKSEDPVLTAAWRGDASCLNRHSQPKRPLYRSLDGGKTWKPLHAPEYSGVPDHLDILALAVSPHDGSLHVDGYCGLYVLPGVE